MSGTAVRPRVPFLDLAPSHAVVRDAILEDVSELLDSGAFTNGPHVAAFERAFAEFCGRPCCIGLSSGLDALRLALLAAGIGPGDEVVVPALTFAATFEAVTQTGATPVPADVRADDFGLDPDAAAAAVTDKTRALLPVHLYGQLADARGLLDVAGRHGLPVVEDACQAHGATRDGLRAGGIGLAAAFSFYPGKNLGAIGDAGALLTADEELAGRVRALREHGQFRKYEHALDGYTARLDTVQAIALLHKLPHLDAWNEQRRAAARLYGQALEGVGDLCLPQTMPGSEPVWHLYVVRTADPDALARHLARRGIGAGRHYPQPPHLAPAFARLGHPRGSFPVAEALAGEVLSLPIFPGITSAQIEAVADAVAEYFRG